MARPERNNVDYFPFICKYGKTMRYIEKKYGNDGYATWIKILRELAVTDHHYLNLSEKMDLMDLTAVCLVSEETLLNIINDLCDFKQFHTGLWQENKIIFSEKFIVNIRDAYKKRNNECIDLEGLLHLLSDLGIRKLYKQLPEGSDNPHIKVENIKVDKSRVSKSLVDTFFTDLPNSEKLSRIASVTNISKEELLKKLVVFKPFARLEYKSFNDFAEHFKSWVVKPRPTDTTTDTQTHRPKKLGS